MPSQIPKSDDQEKVLIVSEVDPMKTLTRMEMKRYLEKIAHNHEMVSTGVNLRAVQSTSLHE